VLEAEDLSGDFAGACLPPSSFRSEAQSLDRHTWIDELAALRLKNPIEEFGKSGPGALQEFAGSGLWKSVGLGALTPEALVLLAMHLPKRSVVSVGCGLAFCERQLHDSGFDVAACDIAVDRSRAWLDAPYVTQIRRGQERAFAARHNDRSLFLSFPDPRPYAEAATRAYLEAGGKSVVLVGPTQAGGCFSSDAGFYRVLSGLSFVERCDLHDPISGARGSLPVSLSLYATR
jgi:hypothetical protein